MRALIDLAIFPAIAECYPNFSCVFIIVAYNVYDIIKCQVSTFLFCLNNVVPGFFSSKRKKIIVTQLPHRGGKAFTPVILKGTHSLKLSSVSQYWIWWSFQDCLRKVTSFCTHHMRVHLSPLPAACPPQKAVQWLPGYPLSFSVRHSL